jgi:hypothetical protein
LIPKKPRRNWRKDKKRKMKNTSGKWKLLSGCGLFAYVEIHASAFLKNQN